MYTYYSIVLKSYWVLLWGNFPHPRILLPDMYVWSFPKQPSEINIVSHGTLCSQQAHPHHGLHLSLTCFLTGHHLVYVVQHSRQCDSPASVFRMQSYLRLHWMVELWTCSLKRQKPKSSFFDNKILQIKSLMCSLDAIPTAFFKKVLV